MLWWLVVLAVLQALIQIVGVYLVVRMLQRDTPDWTPTLPESPTATSHLTLLLFHRGEMLHEVALTGRPLPKTYPYGGRTYTHPHEVRRDVWRYDG